MHLLPEFFWSTPLWSVRVGRGGSSVVSGIEAINLMFIWILFPRFYGKIILIACIPLWVIWWLHATGIWLQSAAAAVAVYAAYAAATAYLDVYWLTFTLLEALVSVWNLDCPLLMTDGALVVPMVTICFWSRDEVIGCIGWIVWLDSFYFSLKIFMWFGLFNWWIYLFWISF